MSISLRLDTAKPFSQDAAGTGAPDKAMAAGSEDPGQAAEADEDPDRRSAAQIVAEAVRRTSGQQLTRGARKTFAELQEAESAIACAEAWWQFTQHAEASAGGAPGGQGAEPPLVYRHIFAESTGKSELEQSAKIAPLLVFHPGASLLKASRGQKQKPVGGGARGGVHGFSSDSRRRMLRMIATIKREAPLPCFVTLTWPRKFPDPATSKDQLRQFTWRFCYAFPGACFIWKLEPQERGAPHYHLLVWWVPEDQLRAWVPRVWYEIAGGGDKRHLLWHRGELGHGNKHCVEQVRTWKGVWNYAAKYLGKSFDVAGWEQKWTGRFWGVVNRESMPFAKAVTLDVERHKAMETIRYGRRFAGVPGRDLNSLTIICDADQWIRNLFMSDELAEER